MRRLTLAVLSVAFLAACQPATTDLTEEQRAAIVAAVGEATAGWIDAVENVDLDAWLAYWHPEGQSYYVDDPAMFLNRMTVVPTVEAMREYWQQAFTVRTAQDIVVEEEYPAVISADAVLHVARGTYTVTDTTGTTEPAPISWTTLWVLHNGQWKILHYHQSWDSPS